MPIVIKTPGLKLRPYANRFQSIMREWFQTIVFIQRIVLNTWTEMSSDKMISTRRPAIFLLNSNR